MTAPRPELKYKRLLLKLSGEALMGKQPYGIDMSVADRLANDIAETAGSRLRGDLRRQRLSRRVQLSRHVGQGTVWQSPVPGISERRRRP